MTRQADYGIVLMTLIAADREQVHNARDLSDKAQLPQPTVTKVLKALARAGVLVSHRGVKGGYRLARRADEISLADIIAALEGPIAITQCSDHGVGCEREGFCPLRSNWQVIDKTVRRSLEGISLKEISQPMSVPVATA
jgi:FeS assembly SUF system regulator